VSLINSKEKPTVPSKVDNKNPININKFSFFELVERLTFVDENNRSEIGIALQYTDINKVKIRKWLPKAQTEIYVIIIQIIKTQYSFMGAVSLNNRSPFTTFGRSTL
jgi:hypothetical protein